MRVAPFPDWGPCCIERRKCDENGHCFVALWVLTVESEVKQKPATIRGEILWLSLSPQKRNRLPIVEKS